MHQDHPSVPADWWKSFFHGAALDLWRAAVTEADTEAHTKCLVRSLGLSAPARVLDAPCGNGRLCLALAPLGYQMTGVDIAPEFIEEAVSASGAQGLAIDWVRGDMRNLPWPEAFDGAFCWGNSFGYFDDDGNAAFLAAVHGALKAAAPLVLDLPQVAEVFLPGFQETMAFEVGGMRLELEHHYDPIRGRVDTDYTFIRDGRAETRAGSHRVYAIAELCNLLETTGFAVETLEGGLDGEPFAIGSRQLILKAKKVPDVFSGPHSPS